VIGLLLDTVSMGVLILLVAVVAGVFLARRFFGARIDADIAEHRATGGIAAAKPVRSLSDLLVTVYGSAIIPRRLLEIVGVKFSRTYEESQQDARAFMLKNVWMRKRRR
jgi:hypothetical protein